MEAVRARTLLLGRRHFGPAPLLLRSAADCGPSAVDGLEDAAQRGYGEEPALRLCLREFERRYAQRSRSLEAAGEP